MRPQCSRTCFDMAHSRVPSSHNRCRHLTERRPSCITIRCARAGRRVAVNATRRTQAFAIFTAQHEGRDCEQPPFAYCRAQVDRTRLSLQQEYSKVIVQTVLARFDEQALDRIVCPHRYLRRASGAFTTRRPPELARETVPTFTSAREKAVYRHRRTGTNVPVKRRRVIRGD